MKQPDWQRLVLDPDWLRCLERQAARRFTETAVAEEAENFVLEQLAEDDWQRCRQFSGRSHPRTFLFSVAARLLEEFARRRYGRVRPPAWLQRQGDLWVTLWKRICLERELVPQVVDRLCGSGRYEPALLHNIVRSIKARLPWCGAADLPVPAEYVAADGRTVDIIEHTAGAGLDDALDGEHLEDTLATLSALMDEEKEPWPVAVDALNRCREQLRLDAEEVLLLRLHFQQGLSFTAIARALGVPRHQPGRQIKQLLARIRKVLDREGVDLPAALETLDRGS